MRTGLLVLASLLLALSPVAADEKKPAEEPPKKPAAKAEPLTPEQAADQVFTAFRAKDDSALQALAAKDNPDPWIVADLLCYRGQHDAAEAFAKAAPRVDVEELPAYVMAWRKREPDTAERELMVAMVAAMNAGQPQQVIEATEALRPAMDTVFRIRLRHIRGGALSALNRQEESMHVLREAADAALVLGWLMRAQVLTHVPAMNALRVGDHAHALAFFREGLALARRRGHKGEETGRILNIGAVYHSMRDFDKALSFFQRGLDLAEKIGHRQWAVNALNNMGNAYRGLGDITKARACYEQARARREVLDDGGTPAETAYTLAITGLTSLSLGDYAKALSTLEQAHKQMQALGDRAGAAAILGHIGTVYERLGDYAKALSTHEQARAQMEALEDKAGAAQALGSIAIVYASLGDYAKSLSTFEQALAQKVALGDKAGAAATLGNIGNIYTALGDYAKALSIQERALTQKVALGDEAGAPQTLGNIGNIYAALGDYAKALSTYEQALAQKVALGDKASAPQTLGQIGTVHLKLGDYAKALSTFEQALAQHEALGDQVGAARTLANIGDAYRLLGDYTNARRFAEKSARAAKSLRATPLLVGALQILARVHLDTGKPSRALAAAQKALDAMEKLLGGLGEEQGATAREQYAVLFAIGTLAAVREEDAAEALTFLESGRAGALLDALDKREALRWKAESLPPELRRLDLRAQAKERAARHAYDLAVERGDLKETRAAAQALDEATEAVGDVAGRIQRDLKQQAGLFYPRAKTLENIESALQKDQALVLYGLFLDDEEDLDEALALVLRHDGERVVSLGKASDIAAACEALDATNVSTDPLAALDALRKLVVDPLKLDKDTKQVLVSPEGPLCYLPFGALFAQTVAMTPSGTTHVLLLGEEREPGRGILALGAPDYAGASKAAQAIYYRGRTLSPLPATRNEVETIGTTTLLGAKASEAGFLEALPASERWRAVHFACHGLVDIERPMLSSLALSHAGEDDGFLTALEILRTKIPADLAVLSACETATGKIVKGEGIVGLTRAFMFAGAPRVICSLWKVDDEATQALMIKFYELWNPQAKPGDPERPKGVEGAVRKGLGAAAALKEAQAYIKTHPKHPEWKHPFYWAAWVLWGLPN